MLNSINRTNKTKNMNNNLKNLNDVLQFYLKEELRPILQNIATEYKINPDELLQKYLSLTTNSTINKSVIPVINEYKCGACTGDNRQCSRSKFNSSHFCQSHDKNKPYGTMEEFIKSVEFAAYSVLTFEL